MGRQILSLLTIGLLLPVVLVSGCSSTPEAGPADSRPAEPGPGGPEIENSRNARGADPCRLLTDGQLGGLRLGGPGIGGPAAEGPRCEWRGSGDTLLELTLYTDGGGIVTLARNSEPTTRRVRVSGYPALETFTGRGEFCQYDVGIADVQVVMLAMQAGTPDSCSTLQTVVPMVVGNLPPTDRS